MTNEHSTINDTPLQTTLTSDDSHVAPGRTLSLVEAAEHFGVSERTVLRRIRKGQLKAHKADTPYGPAWQVTLDMFGGPHPTALSTPDNMPTTASTSASPPELIEMLEIVKEDRRLIDRLQQEASEKADKIAELTGTAAHWQARAVIAEEQARRAEEQVKLLMAPKDEPAEVPEPVAQREQRPWWKRLFS